MSSAPRPQTCPSRSSPENGGTDHSAGSARTTSVCESRSSEGPWPPGMRATRFARSGTFAISSQATPLASRYSRRSSAAAVSLPGGFVVSSRMRRCRRSVTSSRRAVVLTGGLPSTSTYSRSRHAGREKLEINLLRRARAPRSVCSASQARRGGIELERSSQSASPELCLHAPAHLLSNWSSKSSPSRRANMLLLRPSPRIRLVREGPTGPRVHSDQRHSGQAVSANRPPGRHTRASSAAVRS